MSKALMASVGDHRQIQLSWARIKAKQDNKLQGASSKYHQEDLSQVETIIKSFYGHSKKQMEKSQNLSSLANMMTGFVM